MHASMYVCHACSSCDVCDICNVCNVRKMSCLGSPEPRAQDFHTYSCLSSVAGAGIAEELVRICGCTAPKELGAAQSRLKEGPN